MGAGRELRKKRTRERLRAQIARLEERDRLRRQELADTDAALAEAWDRPDRSKALALALADRVYAQHELLARRAEAGPAVVVSETYYPLE